ncbi:hypothetical protein AA313_de0203319 [Arthrobotrys entomopaga]|nr:hypothetical protein AA313_de0203319 [Arthrobotrys entomopaga]
MDDFEIKTDSGLSIRCPSPSDRQVERLYSDIWQVSPNRLSYCSSSGESTVSSKSEKSRRRKTRVHKKELNTSSTPASLFEMSWLDDPSDDEINDEAERIFEEYSKVQPEYTSVRIIRPDQPKMITIQVPTQSIPPMSLENITPPSSPTRPAEEYKDKHSMELLRELDALFNGLILLMEDSPTSFFLLDEKFANILGLELSSLQTHRGAQAFTLPDIQPSIREGVWANAVALQFLRCVMDSPFFKTLTEDVRSQYRLLYSLIELPFSSHIQYLTPAASLTRLSEEELMELASELIQEELIDTEDYTSCTTSPSTITNEKVQKTQDQFVCRPISPPKTPDENDRQQAECEFVGYAHC